MKQNTGRRCFMPFFSFFSKKCQTEKKKKKKREYFIFFFYREQGEEKMMSVDWEKETFWESEKRVGKGQRKNWEVVVEDDDDDDDDERKSVQVRSLCSCVVMEERKQLSQRPPSLSNQLSREEEDKIRKREIFSQAKRKGEAFTTSSCMSFGSHLHPVRRLRQKKRSGSLHSFPWFTSSRRGKRGRTGSRSFGESFVCWVVVRFPTSRCILLFPSHIICYFRREKATDTPTAAVSTKTTREKGDRRFTVGDMIQLGAISRP